MLLEQHAPDDSECVVPTATTCGDVCLGENNRVLSSAVSTGEGGTVGIDANCTTTENTVRGGQQPSRIAVFGGFSGCAAGCTVADDTAVKNHHRDSELSSGSHHDSSPSKPQLPESHP